MDTQNPQNTLDENPGTGEPTQDETAAHVQPESVAGAADVEENPATSEATEPATQPTSEAGDTSDTSDARDVSALDDDGLEETARLPAQRKPVAGQKNGKDAGAAQPSEAGAPLAEGAVIGGYRITGKWYEDASGSVYLAEPEASAPQTEDERPGLRYAVRELPSDAANDQLAHIVAMGLQHPVLLAPAAIAREQGRLFLISTAIATEQGERAPTMGSGERLRPVDALRAGIELADALATLHHNNLAHLHISPDVVTLYEGRIYLGGIEDATVTAADEEESKPLFVRDVNYLARSMGVIGGVLDTPALEEQSSAQRSLREIALRGEAGTYTRAEELAESFALTLQALASGGAEMGADVRSVRLAVSAEAVSSVGRVRAANQDAYGLAYFNIHDDAAADAPVGVFLVADGMGGEAHGEIASRLVARAVTTEMTRQFTVPTSAWPSLTALDPEEAVTSAPRLPLAQALELAVKEANRQTRAFGQRLKATTGSTVTALAISGARAAIAHLGDSRAYLLRDNQLLQLTEDHSLLARMEAMKHPLLEDPTFMVPRSVLYRSVGQEDDVTPDMMEFVVMPGDRVVLCSDGLWDELPPQVIGQSIAEASSPRACAAELVSLANMAGGNDNSTAVAIFFEAEPSDDALLHRAMPARSGESPDASEDDESADPSPDGEREPASPPAAD
ncbi:MAG TPA: protein phosphatase 2C domain-containing protein [Ktedonobacterales bacterium]